MGGGGQTERTETGGICLGTQRKSHLDIAANRTDPSAIMEPRLEHTGTLA